MKVKNIMFAGFAAAIFASFANAANAAATYNLASKEYVDAKDAAATTEFRKADAALEQAYKDADAALEQAYQAADTATLREAKSYADNIVAGEDGLANQVQQNTDAIATINASDVMNSGITATKLAELEAKQGALSPDQLKAVNSGITTEKVAAYDAYETTKQAALDDDQLNAVNSGITEEKVAKYDAYATTKQNALNLDQEAAVDSGITEEKVAKYDAYATTKQDKLTGTANTVNFVKTDANGNVTALVGSVAVVDATGKIDLLTNTALQAN